MHVSNQPTISPQDLRAALDLLATGQARIDGVITHRLPLDRFADGITLFTTRQARKVYSRLRDVASK